MTTTPRELEEIQPYTVEEVQNEFVRYIKNISQYWDAVHEERVTDRETPPTWLETISGFLHSFHVTTTGCAMGFPIGFDMVVTPKYELVDPFDMNDGSLQYTSIEQIDDIRATLKAVERDNLEEEYRLLWHIELAELADKVDVLELSPSEKTHTFVKNLLTLIEAGNDHFVCLDFRLAPHPDDKEYHIAEEEQYYEEGMVFTHVGESLVSQFLALR